MTEFLLIQQPKAFPPRLVIEPGPSLASRVKALEDRMAVLTGAHDVCRPVGLPSIAMVIELVALDRNVSPRMIVSESRAEAISRTRHLAMWLAVACTGKSRTVIARRFNRADHTAVIFGCKRTEQHMAACKTFAATAQRLRRLLNGDEI